MLYRIVLSRVISFLGRFSFAFLCWQLWLVRNERIFQNQSSSQSYLVHKVVQLAIEFFYLACLAKTIKIGIPRIIK